MSAAMLAPPVVWNRRARTNRNRQSIDACTPWYQILVSWSDWLNRWLLTSLRKIFDRPSLSVVDSSSFVTFWHSVPLSRTFPLVYRCFWRALYAVLWRGILGRIGTSKQTLQAPGALIVSLSVFFTFVLFGSLYFTEFFPSQRQPVRRLAPLRRPPAWRLHTKLQTKLKPVHLYFIFTYFFISLFNLSHNY